MDMHGYETAQQRKEHIKALTVELDGVARSIPGVQEQLDAVPAERLVERAAREQDLANLKQRKGEIEQQLRIYKGESPHKRAAKRSESSGVEKR